MDIAFSHTDIVAKDWRRLADFYVQVFGCKPVGPERDLSEEWLEELTGIAGLAIRGVHLSLPGGEGGPTLEIFCYDPLLPRDAGPAINRQGLGHLAFHVDDVETVTARLLEHGGWMLGKTVRREYPDLGLLTVAYAQDPEGNFIEIQNWSNKMDAKDLGQWFKDGIETYPKVYVQKDTPWQQSGFSGPEERWVVCRKPIADCMDRDGTFLDIGCANGYLIECVLKWTAERGVRVTPYGLDIYDGIVDMARRRVPEHADRMFVANAFDWQPPRRFDYVRTELVYVPKEHEVEWLHRLQDEFLNPDGKLLLCEYRGRSVVTAEPWIDEHVRSLGFQVVETRSAYWQGKELTRVAVVPAATPMPPLP